MYFFLQITFFILMCIKLFCSLIILVFSTGWPGLDDTRIDGWTFSGRSVCVTHQFHGQTCLHRPPCQNEVWVSHHYGGGEKVKISLHEFRHEKLMWQKSKELNLHMIRTCATIYQTSSTRLTWIYWTSMMK